MGAGMGEEQSAGRREDVYCATREVPSLASTAASTAWSAFFSWAA